MTILRYLSKFGLQYCGNYESYLFTDDDEEDLSMDMRTWLLPISSRQGVRCHVDTHGLWQAFNRLGLTEMIVTKSGRSCVVE